MSKTKSVTDYKVPTSAQQLMFDFYAMVGLKVRAVEYGLASYRTANSDIELGSFIRDRQLADEAVAMRQQVIEADRARLLRDLPLINAAEVKHLFDSTASAKSGTYTSVFKERFGAKGFKWTKVFKSVLNHKGEYEPVETPAAFKSGNQYVQRYIAAMTASRETGIPLVEVAMLAFDTTFFNWSSAYGGPKWLVIAESWASLMEAQTEDEVIHWIDVINALQHNTTTLFNKCAHYNGHGFLTKVLDVKFAARTPLSFVGLCSEQIQPYLLAVRDGIASLDSKVRDLNASRYYYDADKGLWIEREIDTGKQGSKEAVEFVKTLQSNGQITLKYEGKDRTFQVREIATAIDGSRQFIMRPVGWSKVKPGTSVSISYFPFDETELVTLFVAAGNKGTTASSGLGAKKSPKKKVSTKLELFAQKVRDKIAKQATAHGFGVGAVHESHSVFRFQLKSSEKTNCRYYLKGNNTNLRLYFDYSNEASDSISSMTALVPNLMKFSGKMESLSNKMANGIVKHATEVWANDGPSAVPFKLTDKAVDPSVNESDEEAIEEVVKPNFTLNKTYNPTPKSSKTTAQAALDDLDLDEIEEAEVEDLTGFVKFGFDSNPVAKKAFNKHLSVSKATVTWVDDGSPEDGSFIKSNTFTKKDESGKVTSTVTLIQQVYANHNQVVEVVTSPGKPTKSEKYEFANKELASNFFVTFTKQFLSLGFIQKATAMGG